MEAASKIDALIAEKVMNLPPCSVTPGDGHRCVGNPPAYSTDIAAAWEVAEKARAIKLENREPDGLKGWRCSYNGFLGVGDTAPLAICQAALKATEERAK